MVKNMVVSSASKALKFSLPVLILLTFSISACLGEPRGLYLVTMEEDPVAFLGASRLDQSQTSEKVSRSHAKRLVDSHDQLLQNTLESGSYVKIHSYSHVVNGFSVHTTPSQAVKLKQAKGTRIVERDRGARLMTTYTPEFLDLRGGVWPEQGGERNAGEGMVIAFIDTGINPYHPSFSFDGLRLASNGTSRFSGECETGPRFPASSCNGKIVSARFFSAGAQAIATLDPAKDFLSPFDAVGHGSHVASTAAGNAEVPVVVNGFFYGQASGMAPAARIAVYKTVYPTVSTLTDVIAGIDRAVQDGADIITLSVGPDEPPEDTPTFLSIFDVAMLFARRARVFVVQAAGNRGPGPSSVVSYSPWAVGVASSGTDRTYPASLLLGNGQIIQGLGLSRGSGFYMYKLVLAKDALRSDGSFPRTAAYIDECQHGEALEPSVAWGSIVICTFSEGFSNGTSTVTAIMETAKALGFLGFLLVANPSYGDFIAEPILFDVPGILVPRVSDVQVLMEYYEQHTNRNERLISSRFGARAVIRDGRRASFEGNSPTVSRFSSRGPNFMDSQRKPADVLKPDILAPGHQIWAAWSPTSASDPVFQGLNFALISGTSMATPHVAGIAALIKQTNPTWTPSMIASAIATTATKYDDHGKIIMAEGFGVYSLYPSTPMDLGSGLVAPSRAVDPGLVFSSGFEDYIAFLCSLPGMNPDTVKAATGEDCDISLTHPADLNLPSVTISALTGSQLVKRTVTNVNGEPETYLCAVLPPNGTTVSLSPSWFTIPPLGIQELQIQFNVTNALNNFSFGEIVLTGGSNHIIRMPLSVFTI